MAAPQTKKVEETVVAPAIPDDHLAEIMREQLNELIWHAQSQCGIQKCSECMRFWKVRQVLLYTFR